MQSADYLQFYQLCQAQGLGLDTYAICRSFVDRRGQKRIDALSGEHQQVVEPTRTRNPQPVTLPLTPTPTPSPSSNPEHEQAVEAQRFKLGELLSLREPGDDPEANLDPNPNPNLLPLPLTLILTLTRRRPRGAAHAGPRSADLTLTLTRLLTLALTLTLTLTLTQTLTPTPTLTPTLTRSTPCSSRRVPGPRRWAGSATRWAHGWRGAPLLPSYHP